MKFKRMVYMRKIIRRAAFLLSLCMLCSSTITIFANTEYMPKDDAEIDNEVILDDIDVTENNRVMVKFKNESEKNKFDNTKNKRIKDSIQQEDTILIDDTDYSIITLEDTDNAEDFIEDVRAEYDASIEMIQPDYIVSSFAGAKSGNSINELEDFDVHIEGSTEALPDYDMQPQGNEVIVAVIDTNIDINHDALSSKILRNEKETENGIDDDGNGYVDDIYGWDFINSTDLTQAQFDSNHGTHVAGLVAGGEIGAGENAKILPLKVFEKGKAYTSDIIKAIDYAEKQGAKIVNCSWGTQAQNPALESAIRDSDMLFVCAAGNSSINIDETPVYPAAYEFDNVLCVGASNNTDHLAYFSNYGECVDLTADGQEVYSTFVNNRFGKMMGTSMSAAYVSGVTAALYHDSIYDTKQYILDSCDRISSLEGKAKEGRRINYDNALQGIVSSEVIENTKPDYDQNMITNPDDYQLYDLNPEPKDVYAGSKHSLILNNWGYVHSCGDNTYYQLGAKKDEGYPGSETVAGLNAVEQVSTFADHNLALQGGIVYAWGRNDRLQLGQMGLVSNAVPMPMELFNLEEGSTIVSVHAGGWFSLALDSQGNVWAWGDNTYGQLARGHTSNYSAVAEIAMSGVSKVSAGKYHALVLKDGVVYGWGRNATDYPLGKNAAWSQTAPIQIEGLPNNIVDIVAGDRCSFFITSEGNVYALGLNNNGQLGDGTTTNKETPTLLNLSGVQSISSNGSTLFLLKTGEVFACGENTYGQIGQGHTNTRYTVPSKIHGENYVKVASGGYHNFVFGCNTSYPEDQPEQRAAKGFAMGLNDCGQCGISDPETITYPTIVPLLTYDMDENTEVFPRPPHSDKETQVALRPIDATYISQHDDTRYMNYYEDSKLKINYTKSESDANAWGEYSYLKFDVSDIPRERISSAKLYLNVENDGDMRSSVREIGVFDTFVNDWDGKSMTWSEGKAGARTLLGSFNVTSTGYMIKDIGWHEVDLTDYLKKDINSDLSLMLKMLSTKAHETVITGGTYNEKVDGFDQLLENKYMPALVITYKNEADLTETTQVDIPPLSDTYISQHSNEYNMNFENNEFLAVNYTGDAAGNRLWGQDSYLSFNIDEIKDKYVDSATLWLYVDENSDTRYSTRDLKVLGNYGLQYNSKTLSWGNGRPDGAVEVGGFTVQANGYDVVDPGWKKIDVTDFLDSATDSDIEFIIKMTSNTQHPVKIRSKEYADENTRPRLIIETSFGKLINVGDGTNENFQREDDLDCFILNIENSGYYDAKIIGVEAVLEIYNAKHEKIYSFAHTSEISYPCILSEGIHFLKVYPIRYNPYDTAYQLEVSAARGSSDFSTAYNIALGEKVKFNRYDNYLKLKLSKTRTYVLSGNNFTVYDEDYVAVPMIFSKQTNGAGQANAYYTKEYVLSADKQYYIHVRGAGEFSVDQAITSNDLIKSVEINEIDKMKSYTYNDFMVYKFTAPQSGAYDVYFDIDYYNIRFYDSNLNAFDVFVTNGQFDNGSTLNHNSDRAIINLNKGESIFLKVDHTNIKNKTARLGFYSNTARNFIANQSNTVFFSTEEDTAYNFIPEQDKVYTFILSSNKNQ